MLKFDMWRVKFDIWYVFDMALSSNENHVEKKCLIKHLHITCVSNYHPTNGTTENYKLEF